MPRCRRGAGRRGFPRAVRSASPKAVRTVDEQPDPEGHVVDVDVVGGEGEDGGAGVGGPVAAGGVGDGDEGFPGVGGPVFDGQLGCGGLELVEVAADPAVQVVS